MTLGMHGLNGRRCTAWHTGNDSVKCIDLGCNVGSNLHGATGVISVVSVTGLGWLTVGYNVDNNMDKRNSLVGILAGLCMIVLYVSIWVVGDGTGLWITAGYSGYIVESSIIGGSIG